MTKGAEGGVPAVDRRDYEVHRHAGDLGPDGECSVASGMKRRGGVLVGAAGTVLHGWCAHRRGDANLVWVYAIPDIVRAPEFKHPVQGGSGDRDFRGPGLIRTRTKGIADHAFVSADCCLDFGPMIVAARLCQPIRPCATISWRCRSRCVGAVAARNGADRRVCRGDAEPVGPR
jgi:hypothetical protein